MQAYIFLDGCYFSSCRPRQSFPMFSFQNQHILVYKHQFGCYSSGAAFFLSCEQIPSKCIRRVKLTPHQTYQHDFLTATFASDPVATAYIYKHNMQFNTKKSKIFQSYYILEVCLAFQYYYYKAKGYSTSLKIPLISL